MYVTLNIGPTGVRLLSAEGRKVRKWGSLPLPPGLVKDGVIQRPKVVGTVIDALFKSTGLAKKGVIISLNGLPFIHRTLSLPRMERAARAEAIQRAARKEMLLPPEELFLSAQATGERADETEFFVLGVPRHAVEALQQTLSGAGVTPQLVDLNPLALARAAGRPEAIIVYLEPGCFDIVLVAEGRPAIMRTITPKNEGSAAGDDIRRLAGELAKTLEFYNSNHPRNPIRPETPLLLAGELAAEPTTGPALAETGHPVELLTPPLELPSDLPVAAFAANLGLAMKKAAPKGAAGGYRDINLNIVSDRLREEARRLKWPQVLLYGAVVIALGLLPYLYHLGSRAEAAAAPLAAELSRVNQTLEQALPAAGEAARTEASISKMMAEAAAIKEAQTDLLERGGEYANNLKLVTAGLPAAASFVSVEIGPEDISVAGIADNPFTVVAYVTALEGLKEYAEVRIVSIGDATDGGVAFQLAITR